MLQDIDAAKIVPIETTLCVTQNNSIGKSRSGYYKTRPRYGEKFMSKEAIFNYFFAIALIVFAYFIGYMRGENIANRDHAIKEKQLAN